MARRTKSQRKQSAVHAGSRLALHAMSESQPQALTLSLELPPMLPPAAAQAAPAQAEAPAGSCVIIIDLA